MMRTAIFLLLILLTSCSDISNEKISSETTDTENSRSTEPVYEIITTEIPDKGFGYQILKDGKLIIDQQQIPAIQGNRCFASENDAKRTGELALKKIKDQMFPPTISTEELDSLGIL